MVQLCNACHTWLFGGNSSHTGFLLPWKYSSAPLPSTSDAMNGLDVRINDGRVAPDPLLPAAKLRLSTFASSHLINTRSQNRVEKKILIVETFKTGKHRSSSVLRPSSCLGCFVEGHRDAPIVRVDPQRLRQRRHHARNHFHRYHPRSPKQQTSPQVSQTLPCST